MAALLGKPLVLVNADAALLLSNKVLCCRWPSASPGFDGPALAKLKNAGRHRQPGAREIAALPEPAQRFAGRSGPLRVLVVGGSLGAKALNEVVPQALALIDIAQRPRVTHQTGAANLEAVRRLRARAGVEAELRPFIDDMARQLADCDLIVCRAGAVTVSELCAAGVAAVLVPLVVSTTRTSATTRSGWPAGRRHPSAAGRALAQAAGRAARRPDARGAAGDGDEGARTWRQTVGAAAASPARSKVWCQ